MIWLASALTGLTIALVLASVAGSRQMRTRHVASSGTWLVEAGLDVTPGQFWLTSIGAAGITYLFVYALTSLPVVSVMPALVVAALPKAYFARRRSRNLDEVTRAWPDGLRDLVSSVRSGSSLPNAIENLAEFGPMPLRTAFRGFGVYSRSLGVVRALEMVRSNLSDPTSDRVIDVLILAYERGGVVVPEILNDLAEATTRDIWTLEEVRTEALEQKINARIVFVLPWLVMVAMTARPGPFREFYSSRAGILVAVVGAVLSLTGLVIASRLGRQETEPRVLVSAGGGR
ncbi:MAG: type II secretion system F family protein [Acidimicrobiia bacterium]